jgi:hypothetical protein
MSTNIFDGKSVVAMEYSIPGVMRSEPVQTGPLARSGSGNAGYCPPAEEPCCPSHDAS